MNKVLCVDDSSTVRRYMVKAMEQFKFKNIFEAQNGKEALECIKENEVDLIILDIKMPVMNGIEFLEKLNEDEKNNSIPVVIVSTNPDNDENVKKAMALGAKAYLSKPFQFREMKKTIAGISATV